MFQDEDGLVDLPLPRLPGRHQLVNAGTAVAALRAAGFGRLAPKAFEEGIRNADWPARLQRLARGRLAGLLPQGSELWLDGGHNPDGGKVLAAAMADFEERQPRPLVMIVGMLGTKDSAGFLGPFGGAGGSRLHRSDAEPDGRALRRRGGRDRARRRPRAATPCNSIEAALSAVALARVATSARTDLRVVVSCRRGSRRERHAAQLT